ncbi:MAG: TRAP transporter substrate-binding protein [Deltaproteobacteria bacterium]|nr:TRAP transporter substrate-binding protein [Deltaproteobacteria bacterium]
MKRIARIAMTGLFAAVFFLTIWGAGVAKAAVTELTLASFFAPKTNLEVACEKFKEMVEEKAGGRIKITFYGAGSLYRPDGALSAIAKNMVNMTYLHTGMVASRSPILEFIGSFGAQGCWQSYDHYFRFIDNPEVHKIASAEAARLYNSRILGFFSYGTGLVGSKRPIRKVEDFKGLKIRSSGTAQATIWRSLGAIPTELSAKEMYTALQRGTIEAVNTGTSRIRRGKLYEVAPYLTIDPTTPHVSFFFAINNNAWNGLSPEDQKVIEEAARAIERWTRKNAEKEQEDDYAFFRENKAELIELSDAERTKLLDIVRPHMQAFCKERLGDKYEQLWRLLEASK